jgi:hypothetical protein
MNEQYNNIEEIIINNADNLPVAFDEVAWKKMEALLTKDDDRIMPPFSLNKKYFQKKRWLLLFLCLSIGAGLTILLTKKENITPLANNYNQNNLVILERINTKKQQFNVIEKDQTEKSVFEHIQQDSNGEKVSIQNKKSPTKESNFYINSIEDNSSPVLKNEKNADYHKIGNTIPVVDVPANSSPKSMNSKTKKRKQTPHFPSESTAEPFSFENKKKKGVKKEDASISNDISTTKLDKVDTSFTIKNDTAIIITTAITPKPNNKKKKKFISNFTFSAIGGADLNTVQFKETRGLSFNYGVGINYNITKKLTATVQFYKAQKNYATDKNGYIAPAGSTLLTVDSLLVNASCSIYDIPLTLKYSFKDNTKNTYFVTIGLSSYIMKKEAYDFSYYQQGQYKTRQRTIENQNKHNLASLNFSFGYQHWLSKKWSLGIEPYIKMPIKGIGVGKVNLISTGAFINLTIKPWF